MSPPRVLSTLSSLKEPAWVAAVDMVDRRRMSRRALVRGLVERGAGYDALVLMGATPLHAGYADQLATAALARRRSGPQVVLTEATWERGSQALEQRAARAGLPGLPALGRAARWGVGALDSPRTTFCVLSREEEATFAGDWGLRAGRVVFTPFCCTFEPAELDAPAEQGGYVFAGGDSVRDHGLLLCAAPAMDAPVHVASRALSARPSGELPASVEAEEVPHARFVALMRGAGVVVVPLRADVGRSGGQQTYLNAMRMGKVVVVTDAPGVHDHVEPGRTALVVPPRDPRALAEAVRWALDPRNAAEGAAIGRRARAAVLERFTSDHYLARLLEVARAAVLRGADHA